MAFLPAQLLTSAAHRGLGLVRIVLRLDADLYIKRWQKRNARVRSLFRNNQKLACCPICGFAIAEFEFNDTWLVETCSASGLEPIVNNPTLSEWGWLCGNGQTGLQLKAEQSPSLEVVDSKSTHKR